MQFRFLQTDRMNLRWGQRRNKQAEWKDVWKQNRRLRMWDNREKLIFFISELQSTERQWWNFGLMQSVFWSSDRGLNRNQRRVYRKGGGWRQRERSGRQIIDCGCRVNADIPGTTRWMKVRCCCRTRLWSSAMILPNPPTNPLRPPAPTTWHTFKQPIRTRWAWEH